MIKINSIIFFEKVELGGFVAVASGPARFIMRPDPYKQARSRQYLAKQRAKHGGPSTTTENAKLEKIPQWIKNLPSNASRYNTELDDVNATSFEEKDEFDITSLADLSLETLQLHTKSEAVSSDIKLDVACDLYEELSTIDINKLELLIQQASSPLDSNNDLPHWFSLSEPSKTSTNTVDRTRAKKIDLSKLRPSAEEKNKKALDTQNNTTVKNNASSTSLSQTESFKSGKEEEFLDSLLD